MKKILNILKRAASKDTKFKLSHSKLFYQSKKQNVVFIDNRFPNGFDQVLHYFISGFLQADNTCVIFKYFPRNFEHISSLCNSKGIEWFCYSSNEYIPKINDRLILYPFNSASNSMMVSNRACYHALLLHGESNKVASIKPLTRLYDYVLVAGDLACERLIEYGILTQESFDRGRVIKLGNTVMGNFTELVPSTITDTEAALGYFPTWEGGNDEENLSSLKNITSVLSTALKVTGTKNIVIRFHPHTGLRLYNYKTYARNIIQTLIDQDYKVTYAVINQATAFEETLRNDFKEIRWLNHKKGLSVPIRAAVVDVSALEAVLDVKSIPNLVYVNTEQYIAAPERYWELKKGQHIFSEDMLIPENAFNPKPSDSKGYYEALIGYSDNKLEMMEHSERLIWLNHYVRNNEYWTPIMSGRVVIK